MEKTVVIDEKSVTLKSTAATPLRYKAQFGKDYFAELIKLAKLFEGLDSPKKDKKNKKKDADAKEIDPMDISFESLALLDFETLYNFIWVLAKTADKSIPEPLEWLDQFEEFPLMDIMGDVQELLMSSISTQKK
ncbi:hypothetical protein EP56_05775 [Listeriaceae bacterium FSL A5-0209]|nr:hypothetical protein EP56_05775 [Listeriaceae bacterium FSL A5-0209]